MVLSLFARPDYIVIGAGSAGCVLAARLSEHPDVKVLLLESGGADISPLIKLPVGYARTLGDPKFDWCYQAGPEPGLSGRNVHYARGKVLGGSSSINGLVWARGGRADYDRWATLGCDDWGWDQVLPYFMRAEDFAPGGNGRGRDGPVKIDFNPGWHDSSAKLVTAAQQEGLPYIADYNVDAPIGLSRVQLNWHRGHRVSAAAAYLDPVRSRANLQIVTNATVDTIEIENGAATGVRLRLGGEDRLVSSAREVILCAGAFGSPLLLEKSGVGQADRLARLGLPVVADVPELGENLRDHLLVMMNYRLSGLHTINAESRGWRTIVNILRYGLFRSGPLTGTPTEVLGYARAGDGDGAADIQMFSAPLTFSMGTTPAGKVKIEIDKLPGMSFGLYPCHPKSRGHVHMTSPTGDVSIVSNYLTEQDDCEIMIRGLKLCRRIMEQAAISSYVESEIAPGAEAGSDAALLDYARRAGSSSYHAAGTCRMGTDPASVVDTQLRMRAVRRLRIADASVMPDLVGSNTHAPTVMIAERAADFITGRRP